jgi:hypothetical protein
MFDVEPLIAIVVNVKDDKLPGSLRDAVSYTGVRELL